MTDSPMNVLVILVGQQNAGWMGCAGHPQALTPRLDAFAGEALRCDNAWCQSPICTPSRVSLFSGQYAHSHGYQGLSGPRPMRLPSLFGHFRAAGYRTGAIGKLHFPDEPVSWLSDDVDLLIDIHRGNRSRDPSPYQHYLDGLGLTEVEDSRGLKDLDSAGAHVVCDHDARPSRMPLEHAVESYILRQAERFLRGGGKQAKPFFLHLSFPRPHHALTPDQRFWDLYPEDLALPGTFAADPSQRPPHFRDQVAYLRERHRFGYEPRDLVSGSRRVWRGTLASVSQNDHFIGRVFDLLRELGRWDDTAVVFSSDHGAYHGLHGIMEKAPGLSSREVCRVPLLMRVPGVTRPGSVGSALVEHLDLAATLPAVCGLPPMPTAQGIDLAPLMRGEAPHPRAAAVTELPWSKSIRFGAWRLVHYHRRMFPGEDAGELYHADDPDERRNRYADPACAAVVAEGRRLLLEWMTDTTRVITAYPPLRAGTGPAKKPHPSVDAGDGREAPDALGLRLAQARIGQHGDARCYL